MAEQSSLFGEENTVEKKQSTRGAGCQTSGYGTHTISQSSLYNAIENDNGNGALIW